MTNKEKAIVSLTEWMNASIKNYDDLLIAFIEQRAKNYKEGDIQPENGIKSSSHGWQRKFNMIEIGPESADTRRKK
jgi:hypothetical protein